MYDRIQGVLPEAIGEGTHIRIPWLQSPAVMDIRTRPRSISSVTGTKGETISILNCLIQSFTFKVHPTECKSEISEMVDACQVQLMHSMQRR